LRALADLEITLTQEVPSEEVKMYPP